MEQLRLFPRENRAVVLIQPQPVQALDFFKGEWQWAYSRSSALVTADPETSKGMLERSPYQPGSFYGSSRVVDRVSVKRTRIGFVWVVELRDEGEDEIEAYWRLLRASVVRPPEMVCQYCGEREKVILVPAMTAYHHEPGEPDPNAPLLLCVSCAEDYTEYWTERWKDYEASLL